MLVGTIGAEKTAGMGIGTEPLQEITQGTRTEIHEKEVTIEVGREGKDVIEVILVFVKQQEVLTEGEVVKVTEEQAEFQIGDLMITEVGMVMCVEERMKEPPAETVIKVETLVVTEAELIAGIGTEETTVTE